MKPTDFSHASESFKRLNPHVFGVGAVPAAKPEPALGQPASDAAGQAGGEGGVGSRHAPAKRGRKIGRVCLVAFRHRLLDDDNLAGSLKHLRDAIADSLLPGLAPGAADAWFAWEYGHVKTDGEEGTIVKIEL